MNSQPSALRRMIRSLRVSGTVKPRRAARPTPTVDRLEDRVVLSLFGGAHHTPSPAQLQLQTAQAALQTAIQTVQSISAVTVSDITKVQLDLQAIRAAGFRPNTAALVNYENDLLSGASATTTAADLATLSTGASVTVTPLIANLTADLTALSADYASSATGTTAADDLAAVVTDAQKVQADQVALGRTLPTPPPPAVSLLSVVSGGGGLGGDGFCDFSIPGSGTTTSALGTALKTLQTDTQAVQRVSKVTVADETAVWNDLQALWKVPVRINGNALFNFENELVLAAAGSAKPLDPTMLTATLTTDFAKVFPTTLPTGASTLLKDLVKVANDYAGSLVISLTATPLTLLNQVATDELAVQTALANLFHKTPPTTTPPVPYYALVTGRGF